MKNDSEKKKEYQRSLANFEQPVLRIIYPAGQSNPQDIAAGYQPRYSCRYKQCLFSYSVSHVEILTIC